MIVTQTTLFIEEEMQYLHDNLNMHVIHGGKMQYPRYDSNPHYMWEH
jgi:hypothetical protein